MLEIIDIHVYRGQTYVLQGVSLAINRGEIVALIGANGAGKTSMLRTVSGLLKTKRGRIIYQPREKIKKSISAACRLNKSLIWAFPTVPKAGASSLSFPSGKIY